MRPLTWWEWLVADSESIRRLGHDPTQRIVHTGHERALSSRWAQTIGMWGRASPAVLLSMYRGPHDSAEAKQKARWSYDLFKNRNRLKSPRNWMAQLGSDDSKLFLRVSGVMIATLAHSRMRLWHMTHQDLSMGACASQAVLYEEPSKKEKNDRDEFGALPIEMLLYYHAIEHVMEESGLTPRTWSDVEGAGWLDRADLWKEHDAENLVALPQVALETYPVEYA